jgi:hypothetical protein
MGPRSNLICYGRISFTPASITDIDRCNQANDQSHTSERIAGEFKYFLLRRGARAENRNAVCRTLCPGERSLSSSAYSNRPAMRDRVQTPRRHQTVDLYWICDRLLTAFRQPPSFPLRYACQHRSADLCPNDVRGSTAFHQLP